MKCRMCKNRRIFGILPISLLETKDGSKLEDISTMCMCEGHSGGQKVKLKTGFNEDEYVTLYEIGEIKG